MYEFKYIYYDCTKSTLNLSSISPYSNAFSVIPHFVQDVLFLHTTRLEDIVNMLHIVICILYVDEIMTSVPRLTGSLTTDCDTQSNERAPHIEEYTEQEIPSLIESGGSPRPSSPRTDDEGIDLTCHWVTHHHSAYIRFI